MEITIHPILQMFVQSGVPLQTIALILLFPFIATLVAILRQVVGVKAFGIYTPAIITFAFLEIGLKYGILAYIVVVILAILLRLVLKNLRILYLPRVAITLTIVSLALLLTLVIGGSLQRTGLAAVSILPILIIISLAEKFVAVQIDKGTKTALFLAIETLIVALIGFFLMRWDLLIALVIEHPWIVLLVIPFNILLGKWTGLRLLEYIRFREVLKKM